MYTFIATDADTRNASRITFSFLEENEFVHIDNKTGNLKTITAIDREIVAEILVIVVATDSAPSPFEKSTQHKLNITILDVNDNMPTFVSNATMSIPETTVLSSVAFQIIAEDPDEGDNGRIVYSVTANNDTDDIFKLVPKTGEFILQSKCNYIFDYSSHFENWHCYSFMCFLTSIEPESASIF